MTGSRSSLLRTVEWLRKSSLEYRMLDAMSTLPDKLLDENVFQDSFVGALAFVEDDFSVAPVEPTAPLLYVLMCPPASPATPQANRAGLPSVIVPFVTFCQQHKPPTERRCMEFLRLCLASEYEANKKQPIPSIQESAELRIPEGKHVRHSLTLRNTAALKLQTFAQPSYDLRGRRKAHLLCIHFSCVGECRNIQIPDLMATSGENASLSHVYEPIALQSSLCLHVKRAVDRVEKSEPYISSIPSLNNKKCPSLLLGPTLCKRLPLVFEVAGEGSLSCSCPEENDCGHSLGDLSIFLPRVFPRGTELQNFRAFYHRMLKRTSNDPQQCGSVNVNREKEVSGDAWIGAAYVHDVETTPLAYRTAADVAEDARLHYSHLLALHCDKRMFKL
ncbi:hypothetical protein, conserved (fragment) [Trypanosoma vivax Y486]|uniref:Uncharacterized protein n=1 Tax=Trypanosoma vivax (strain Y486) TaxID=1055687 RepID=F9WTW2_TRYVY